MQYKFLHGEALSLMAALEDGSVDHIITDPPYSAEVQNNRREFPAVRYKAERHRLRDFNFAPLDEGMIGVYARAMARLVRRWVLVFSAVEQTCLWREALEEAGLRYIRTGIWVKDNPPPSFSGDRPGVGYESYVLAHPPGKTRWNGGGKVAVHRALTPIDRGGARSERKVHPAQKPLALMEELVALYTDPDELILDPFAGVATTGVAALHLGRRFIGCEIEEVYWQQGKTRLEAAAMRQALISER